jgi:hypothetical protein
MQDDLIFRTQEIGLEDNTMCVTNILTLCNTPPFVKRLGIVDVLFVSVGHPRTEVELGYTFGVPVMSLALADPIPGT